MSHCRAAAPPPTRSQPHSRGPLMSWRLELFFKSPNELQAQLPFLKRHGVSRVNITNKSSDDNLLASVARLREALPGLDVCVHYSIKHNYDRSPAAALARLQAFCSQLQEQLSSEPAAGAGEPPHVLLVSGGGKKKAFNTVTALQQLAAGEQKCKRQKTETEQQLAADSGSEGKQHQHQRQQQQQASHERQPGDGTPFAVAFNPYLPDPADADAERRRLEQKLATGLPSRVYLQMGCDLERLASGLEFLQDLLQQREDPLQLFGSVFIPSKRLLAQMKFRPWNGVFLSEQYLSNVEAAEAITRDLLAAYAAAGVVPLVETAVKNDEEMTRLQALLQQRW